MSCRPAWRRWPGRRRSRFGRLAAQLAFLKNVWLPLIEPVAALAAAAVTVLLFRYWFVDRVGRRVRSAFCHYLAPSVVDRLVDSDVELRLGGERREVTIMFADLSGFTAMSTRLSPEELMALTNSYHALMVEAVEANGGYVNQFVGDAVMAIFGAPAPDPDHAASAARAALRIVTNVMQAKAEADRRGVPGYAVKIGLNTGPAVIGNVGAPKRYNYTAVGETVNIAARLEGVPEDYGCRIVVGPNTAAAIGDRFVLCELDWIKVKGKDTAFSVYQLIGEKSTANGAELRQPRAIRGGAETLSRRRLCRRRKDLALQADHPNPGAAATSPPLVMAGRCASSEDRTAGGSGMAFTSGPRNSDEGFCIAPIVLGLSWRCGVFCSSSGRALHRHTSPPAIALSRQ